MRRRRGFTFSRMKAMGGSSGVSGPEDADGGLCHANVSIRGWMNQCRVRWVVFTQETGASLPIALAVGDRSVGTSYRKDCVQNSKQRTVLRNVGNSSCPFANSE